MPDPNEAANRTIAGAFWQKSPDTLFADLGADTNGLASAEAAARLRMVGANIVTEDRRRSLVRKIARRFADPLIAILLAAAAVSSVSGDVASFAIIFSVIALSISLDVIQQHRAENAAETLKRLVAIHADLLRDGSVRSIPVAEVVPGDIVSLAAGDLVPADGLLLDGRDVHVNEALLTGEPFPVEKRPGACLTSEPADAFNALFSGTSIINGEARMLVVATGAGTRFGSIAARLASEPPPTAFERGIHGLAMLILRLTVFLVLFVLLVNVAFGRPVVETFLFAVALAVGLTPELLPMVTTVSLSRGAMRLARKRAIVKRLAAIHDLGAMDVLCTDKTGTLTEAKITLAGHPDVSDSDSAQVLLLAAVNSVFSAGIRSPLDQAIVNHWGDADLSGWRKRDEIPFDFERRCVSVLAESNGRRLLVLKGAAEDVLGLCSTHGAPDGSIQSMTADLRTALLRRQEHYAAQGFRVLAVAWKEMAADTVGKTDERDLAFVGFCLFLDPPKESAAGALARLRTIGVGVKVVSGDHPAVVRHVAASLGLGDRALMTGSDIANLSDAALSARVAETDFFARVSPDQKTRIIRALQLRGHAVGFIGDGVNDAPAIHAADVGLSVDGATDVARSAADIILLSPDLRILADGIEEGRRTFANILKYVRMGTSSNFGNMLSMALASAILPFLPLLPVQVLLNNLLYDLSEIGIPLDRVERADLERPRAWDMRAILRFTLVMGVLSSVFDFLTFAILLKVFHVDAAQFRTAWFAESLVTQILVIFVIRTHRPLWRGRPHPALAITSLIGLAAAMIVLFTPLAGAFGFVALPGRLMLAIGALVVAYLGAAEALKHLAVQRANR